MHPSIALGRIPVRTHWTPRAGASDPAEVRYAVDGRTDEHVINMDVRVALSAGASGTTAAWSIGLLVTGTLRSAGQRTLRPVVAAQAAGVLAAVDRLAAAA